jgi:hypothetical protein
MVTFSFVVRDSVSREAVVGAEVRIYASADLGPALFYGITDATGVTYIEIGTAKPLSWVVSASGYNEQSSSRFGSAPITVLLVKIGAPENVLVKYAPYIILLIMIILIVGYAATRKKRGRPRRVD